MMRTNSPLLVKIMLPFAHSMVKKTCKLTKGKAGKGKIESQCSAAWLNDKKYANQIITGGSDGCVYHWTGDSVTKKY